MPDDKQPATPPEVAAYDGLAQDARADADSIIAADVVAMPWRPLVNLAAPDTPTPQASAFTSPADVLFYGGAAGGGKTDLLIGLALTCHRRTLLLRREHKRLRAIQDRMAEILGSRAGFNSQAGRWRLPVAEAAALSGAASPVPGPVPISRILDMGGCQHAGDERAWQGQPHDLVAFDEITDFLESQFRFLLAWNRSTVPGQRCRVVATGNPPTTPEGEWVSRYFAPWLDANHPHPALPGELRWFASLEDGEHEVESGTPFVHAGETITPKSRTFIPSRIEDNPYLMATGYRATLQALPEPLRSQMLKGDFTASAEDDPWGVIPQSWVIAAQTRWREAGSNPDKDLAMTALGVDVAQGGRDETVLSPRYGSWFAEQIYRPGVETPNGPSVAALVVSQLRDGAVVGIDLGGGWGGSAFDHLRENGIAVEGLVPSERSTARDATGALGFINRRAEMWWQFREALDPARGQRLCLPPDARLLADLTAPRWKLTARGIQVEEKREINKRLGRSPDRGEAAIYALAADERLILSRARARRRKQKARVENNYDPLGW